MEPTHADIADGKRIDIAVELITRRAFQTDHGSVHRLIVADREGTRFPVLVATDRDALHDLKTGATYRFEGLLGAVPGEDESEPDPNCPSCGGLLRGGRPFDAVGPAISEVAAALSFDVAFGVIDARTTVQRVDRDTAAVDDWVAEHASRSLAPPAYVCTDCDRHLGGIDAEDPGEASPQATHASPERMLDSMSSSMASPETVGLATGGATDVTNFRENVSAGYTPKPGSITEEGLFYDYFFETGSATDTAALFAPRYAAATSVHPLTDEEETYLSVGLDSSLAVEDFERPPLELVVVLDVSGSMNSAFDEYYYDEHGRRRETGADATTKIDAATQSVCALTEQLRPSDRLGIVLFDGTARVAKPLRNVGSTDMAAIRRHVEEVRAGGGTNLVDGFDTAVSMLREEPPAQDVEQRVIFTTDMMPNTGVTDESDLERLFGEAAVEGIHTTFVGMGLDENADLVEALSGIRGANHYFVNSAAEFERRLGEEFDCMVTPLVYDLSLDLEADGYEVEAVHGSPGAEESGPLVHVGTLFPSAKQDGEARGGVILVRLTRTGAAPELDLVASWSERGGGTHSERVSVDVPQAAESFEHDGVRKAIALSRYARELRSWATVIHEGDSEAERIDDWQPQEDRGQYERGSVPLAVPTRYAERFDRLRSYLEAEMKAVGDDELQRELDLLDTLCAAPSRQPEEVVE